MTTKSLTGTALYNHIVDTYGEHFEKNCTPSFINLIWQVAVNNAWAERKVHCFSVVLSKGGGYEIGIAEDDELGYSVTSVQFDKQLSYDTANDITDKINEDLFGLTPIACMEIVMKSMRT